MKNSISIIVPIYNEELRLNEFFNEIKNLSNYLNDFSLVELIFVDDGSNDNSVKLIEEAYFGQLNKVILKEHHVGMMNAIFAGIKKASTQNIITIEADFPIKINEVMIYLKKFLENKYDLLVGSRYLEIKPKNVPLIRKIVSKCYLFLFNHYFNIKISDPQIGFKIFKKDKFNLIYNFLKIKYDGLKSSQLIILFYMFGFNMAETSVQYEYKENSKNFNLKNFLKVIFINIISFFNLVSEIKKIKNNNKKLNNPFK